MVDLLSTTNVDIRPESGSIDFSQENPPRISRQILPNHDQISGKSVPAPEQNASLIDRFWKLLGLAGNEKPSEVTRSVTDPKYTPINIIPEIQTPPNMSTELQKIKLPKAPKQEVILSDLEKWEGLSRMNTDTIHFIYMVVAANQAEIAKDGALACMDTLLIVQKERSKEQKILQGVKIQLERDTEVMGYFKTSKTVALFAGTVSTLMNASVISGITSAVTTGAFTAASLFVGPPLAAAVASTTGATMMATLTLLPAISGAFGAGSALLENHFKGRTNEDKCLFKETHHNTQVYGRLTKDIQDRIAELTKSKGESEKKMAQTLKELAQLLDMLQKK